MPIRGMSLAAAFMSALLLSSSAVAADAANSLPPPRQTAAPAASPQTGAFEDVPFSFPAARQPQRQSRSGTPSILSILLYVFVFCALFIVAIWLVKRFMPGHRQFFNHPALEVLGRTHLDQRRFVSLIRVGRRVLVVGVTPDEITSLAEIADGMEVAEILEQARPKTEAGKTLFAKLFHSHIAQHNRAEAEGELDSQAEALADDIGRLRSRIRSE